ncbi:MAG: hypothetical protein PVG30_08600 [Gammaproteobacteria bacterium]
MKESVIPSIKEQFFHLKTHYPNLKLTEVNGGLYTISGDLEFVANYAQLEAIQDKFNITITVPANYPKNLPTVTENMGRIPKTFHKLEYNTFCLGTPLEIRIKFSEDPTLYGFVRLLIVPYLFSFCYYERHKEMPYGEYSHGGKGIIEYYKNKFNTMNDIVVLKLIRMLAEGDDKGYKLCPCKSKKTFKNCHRNIFITINKLQPKKDFIYEFSQCLDHCKKSGLKLPKSLFSKEIKRLLRKYHYDL